MNWDYLIVGAGSAGCALAHELVTSARNERVLLLEAGGSDWSPYIRIPAGQIRAITNHDWGYQSQPDPTRNGAMERWRRGRVLGGSSSVNGTVYVRGSTEDFNRWGKQCGRLNNVGWSSEDVMPIFRELENSDQTGSRRGRGGPLNVRTVRRPHALTKAFVEAALACGHPFNEDYNGDTQEGISYAQLSQRNGLRCSAADAFLRPLVGRKNFKLLLNASVQKIEFSNGRAIAVTFLNNDKLLKETGREIIICAGAINSPKLLMLSGIGDPRELGRHKIDVEVDLPTVGCNLREHPLLRLIYRTRVPTHNLTEGLLQKLQIAAEFAKSREGPVANLFEATAFLKSSPSEPNVDMQLHFVPLGYLKAPDGTTQIASYPSVTVLLNKSHPNSSGHIRLASSNPREAPLIECRLLEDAADMETLVQGIGSVREIVRTQPLAGFIHMETAPGPGVDSVAPLKDYIRKRTEIAFHPVGTCRMGTDTASVVSPDLRVRGTENLWIADASIMPDLISGNTNATCMMIGMKLGKQLIARNQPPPATANSAFQQS